jgi:hypothetical protein
MQVLEFIVAEHLGDVDSGLIVALLAFHRRGIPESASAYLDRLAPF